MSFNETQECGIQRECVMHFQSTHIKSTDSYFFTAYVKVNLCNVALASSTYLLFLTSAALFSSQEKRRALCSLWCYRALNPIRWAKNLCCMEWVTCSSLPPITRYFLWGNAQCTSAGLAWTSQISISACPLLLNRTQSLDGLLWKVHAEKCFSSAAAVRFLLTKC